MRFLLMVKFWNNLKYWQKGAMIGFIISFIFVSLFSFWANSVSVPSSPEFVSFELTFIIMFVVYVIPAMVIGSIIGLIVGKFDKK